jgi:pyruvate kinase
MGGFCKQLATLGPASSDLSTMKALVEAGADAFRLNFSHGAHDEKAKLVDMIRFIEEDFQKPIAILGDLQGPKLRVGVFADTKVTLETGQSFRFDLDTTPGDTKRVNLPHPEIINTLKDGDILLLDDGKLKMKVVGTAEGAVDCEVLVGGPLSNKKGVNTPTIVLPISPLTEKDRVDLDFALSLKVDWIALSFVQKAEDVQELKDIVQGRAKVMTKLEKPSAVEDLERIVDVSDGVMVARGDLGVEMNPEDVPVIQKQAVSMCRENGKPVVIATQMLESMITAPTPTRAEASDVASAVYDGADAVMLSAESAAGAYPIESVRMQRSIIERVEKSEWYLKVRDAEEYKTRMSDIERRVTTDAIAKAARDVADAVDAKAILSFTSSGTSVLRAAAARPMVPVVAITPTPEVARHLALVWGVSSCIIPPGIEIKTMMYHACKQARALDMIDSEDTIVMTAGLPFGSGKGHTNFLRVLKGRGPDVSSWETLRDEGA